MKKMTLLFTILCVSALNDMEAQNIRDLPKDIHNEIIKMALAKSNTLTEAIKAIKVANALRGVQYDNLKDFTKLVHILADKFNIMTSKVTEKFKTLATEKEKSLTEKYIHLTKELNTALQENNITQTEQAIKQGADVNFVWDFDRYPLYLAVRANNLEMVTLLLNAGANLNLHSDRHSNIMELADFNIQKFNAPGHMEHLKTAEGIKKILLQSVVAQNALPVFAKGFDGHDGVIETKSGD